MKIILLDVYQIMIIQKIIIAMEVDLGRQKELDANPKAIQQIELLR